MGREVEERGCVDLAIAARVHLEGVVVSIYFVPYVTALYEYPSPRSTHH